MTNLCHLLCVPWKTLLMYILQNYRLQEVFSRFASRRHGGTLHPHISRFVEKARKMLTKPTIGTPSLKKITSSTPAINIAVIGSSNISVKTEVSSPEQEVQVNAKVIDSSQVTVKSELSLSEQVLHMNTEVMDSTQVTINTCVANDSF